MPPRTPRKPALPRRSEQISENLEQAQESMNEATCVTRSDLSHLQPLADELIAALADVPNGDLVGDVVSTAIKLLRDRTNRGDVKLLSKSLKELRYALKIFAPYREVRKVSIFGSARTLESHHDYRQAASYAREMAAAGWMVITGAGGGIMAAGHAGAQADPSFGLAIRLPFEQKTNPYIENDPKLINFKYFFTRKLMFVRSSHAISLFPGGFGTMDEGFEVLTLIQTGKCPPMPVIMVDAPGGTYWAQWQEYVETQLLERGLIGPDDLRLYKITDDVQEAVRETRHFYSNFHSIRYHRDDLIIRLHRKPTDEQVRDLSARYASITTAGAWRTGGPLKVEADEPALDHLHRLVFAFNKRDHGRLRMLIDDLNDLPQ
jgi:uncharacterized protein (TIGR00730 family)